MVKQIFLDHGRQLPAPTHYKEQTDGRISQTMWCEALFRFDNFSSSQRVQPATLPTKCLLRVRLDNFELPVGIRSSNRYYHHLNLIHASLLSTYFQNLLTFGIVSRRLLGELLGQHLKFLICAISRNLNHSISQRLLYTFAVHFRWEGCFAHPLGHRRADPSSRSSAINENVAFFRKFWSPIRHSRAFAR